MRQSEEEMPQMIIVVVASTKPQRSMDPDFDISYLRRRSEHNISRGERREERAKREPAGGREETRVLREL